ncbi:prepilin peptidase [Streptomyces sp. NPDC059740]|uniref:prepilin peptidase n=1 Tax=Streptomyces sp. NPDC059740 TaxID=3346926 RepID=UPI0036467F7E
MRPEAVVWVLAVPVGVVLGVVDVRARRLPDVVTLPLTGGLLALLGLCALLPRPGGSWTGALVGGLVLGGFYGVLHLVNPGGMGLGDVKLACALGVPLGWYGWDVLFLGAFAGLLLGGLYGTVVLLTRRTSGDATPTTMAFGPFLLAGAFLGVLLGAAAGR